MIALGLQVYGQRSSRDNMHAISPSGFQAHRDQPVAIYPHTPARCDRKRATAIITDGSTPRELLTRAPHRSLLQNFGTRAAVSDYDKETSGLRLGKDHALNGGVGAVLVAFRGQFLMAFDTLTAEQLRGGEQDRALPEWERYVREAFAPAN